MQEMTERKGMYPCLLQCTLTDCSQRCLQKDGTGEVDGLGMEIATVQEEKKNGKNDAKLSENTHKIAAKDNRKRW